MNKELIEQPLVKKLKTAGGHYIYDVRTNRLIRVTPAMYDAIDYFGSRSHDEIITILGGKYSEEEIRYALTTFDKLSMSHQLFRPGPLARRVGYAPREVLTQLLSKGAELITLEVTSACNLRCKYCIFSGEYQYTRTHGKQHMTFDIAKPAIDFHRSLRVDADSLAVGFYGGEPLLNFDLIRRCCEYVRACEEDDKLMRPIRFGITTNGTLLSEERVAFFIEQGFSMTISLDGPQEIHDDCRVDAKGRGTFEIVFRNLQHVYEMDPHYYDEHILINCVISPSTNPLILRKFFDSYPHLFGNKLSIGSVSEGNPSFFANHMPYIGRDMDMEQLHEEYRAAHISGNGSADWFHNSFVRQLFERDYLLLHRRPILEKGDDNLDRITACVPGLRKVFVDIDGQFHMCERVNRHFPIGDVWHGYDISKIAEVFNLYCDYMDSEECRECWAVQRCPHCFTIGADGQFPSRVKYENCPNYRRLLEVIINSYCSILERNPKAFDYMNDYVIS